jgi:hypothetical protein
MTALLMTAALAMEGMWLPEQVPSLSAELAELGLQVPLDALADPARAPLSAIVSVGGFCSGSFISPDGLVLTNLHCADGWLGQIADAEHPYLDEGLRTASRADERPAGPSARLYVVDRITDVTATVRSRATEDLSDLEWRQAVDRISKELIATCEKAKGYRCRVAAYDHGLSFRLIRSLELRDLRFVQAPPANVGFFGGDRDNFEWPRHDGDYSLLRAYVGPDGRPAAYHPSNVPYRPAHHLPIQAKGVVEGEAVFVAGFPGGTDRYAMIEDLEFQVRVSNPEELEWSAWAEGLMGRYIDADPAAADALQTTLWGLENGRKYTQGIQDNVSGSTLLRDKAALAARLDAWIAADPARVAKWAAPITRLRELLREDQATWPTDLAVGRLYSATLLDAARTAVRWAAEREKKRDLDRDRGYQDRDRDNVRVGLEEANESLWQPAEREATAHALLALRNLPPELRVPSVDALVDAAGGVDAYVAHLYDHTTLASADARLALLSLSSSQLAASKDPFVQLAVTLEREHSAAARTRDKASAGAWQRAFPLYVEAVRTMVGGRSYPDANGTLRVTFGKVRGYAPRDGLIATPFTTLAGWTAKHRGPHYEGPGWLASAIEAHPTHPVNFLSDVDTTGGNSGSATLNARGELVGLLFDGNYESMAADWQFDDATTRSVHVDVRYLLWLIEQQGGAWILGELDRAP